MAEKYAQEDKGEEFVDLNDFKRYIKQTTASIILHDTLSNIEKQVDVLVKKFDEALDELQNCSILSAMHFAVILLDSVIDEIENLLRKPEYDPLTIKYCKKELKRLWKRARTLPVYY